MQIKYIIKQCIFFYVVISVVKVYTNFVGVDHKYRLILCSTFVKKFKLS